MTHPWELRRRHRLLLFYIGIHTRVHTFDNIGILLLLQLHHHMYLDHLYTFTYNYYGTFCVD